MIFAPDDAGPRGREDWPLADPGFPLHVLSSLGHISRIKSRRDWWRLGSPQRTIRAASPGLQHAPQVAMRNGRRPSARCVFGANPAAFVRSCWRRPGPLCRCGTALLAATHQPFDLADARNILPLRMTSSRWCASSDEGLHRQLAVDPELESSGNIWPISCAACAGWRFLLLGGALGRVVGLRERLFGRTYLTALIVPAFSRRYLNRREKSEGPRARTNSHGADAALHA